MRLETWFRGAVVLGGLLASALLLLGPPRASADLGQDEADLTLSPGLEAFTNDVGMKFVPVRKGSFLMGSPKDEKDRQADEPQHRVEITKDFYLGATEVTQKQYETVVGHNPSSFSKNGSNARTVQGVDTSKFPVETVSYDDAVKFVEKLNARDSRRSGWKYALPTEAQWEYACRGGPDATAKPIRFAKPSDSLGVEQANFDGTPYNGGNAAKAYHRPRDVASYEPNNLGLYDMHGNVWEWCADWYTDDYGGKELSRDPTGPAKGTQRVLKSACYYNSGWECRAARRCPYSSQTEGVGFRVAFVQAK